VSAGLATIGMTVGPSASYWWRSGYLAPLDSFSVFVVALAARQLLGLQGGLIHTLVCAVLGLAVGGPVWPGTPGRAVPGSGWTRPRRYKSATPVSAASRSINWSWKAGSRACAAGSCCCRWYQ
jgi:hypothetical protein